MYLRTNQRWDDKQKGEQVTIDSTILCSNTNNISYENLIARRGKARLVIIIITRLKGPRLATYVRYLFLNISNAPSFLFVIIDSLNKNIIRFHVFAYNKISRIKKIPKLRKSSRIYVPEEKTKMLVWDFFGVTIKTYFVLLLHLTIFYFVFLLLLIRTDTRTFSKRIKYVPTYESKMRCTDTRTFDWPLGASSLIKYVPTYESKMRW